MSVNMGMSQFCDDMKTAKELKLYDCPYHKVQPWFYGPDLTLPITLNGRPPAKDMMFWVLSRFFPDAILFEHGYTVFCPECAKKNPTPGKHNKFGFGFCSQYALQSAKHNWNKACLRFTKSAITNVLKGK